MKYCCTECFKDPFLKEIIVKFGEKGNCDFCGAKDVQIYDISEQNLVSDKIIELLQIYESSSLPESKPLKIALRDDWNIFYGGTEVIQTLVLALCDSYPEYNSDNPIFSNNVIMPQAYEKDYIDQNCVVKGQNWHLFSEYLKHENRFHSKYLNGKAFAKFLPAAEKVLNQDEFFYRARIAFNESGFQVDEMYAPPQGKRKQGRINPEEIGVLYLASDVDTALHEVRASKYDYVTIGTFVPVKSVRVVNLSALSKVSPFLYEDLASVVLNKDVFKEMALEIAKPQRRSDSPLEYLSTQYISEFVKAQGYDGVAYDSTLSKDGYNLAIYDETSFKCVQVNTIEVTEIDYKYNKIQKPDA